MLTTLQTYHDLVCVGIDEETAILVSGTTATVEGEGQVIVIEDPSDIKVNRAGAIGMKKIELSLYLKGDSFLLKREAVIDSKKISPLLKEK